MKFVELDAEEFDKHSCSFEGNSFYQTSKWSKVKEYTGWIHYFLGVKKGNKLLACTLVLGKKLCRNKYMYYAPRGILLDYNNKELLTFFITEIKKFLINKNGVIFKIDPLIIYKHHDKYGNLIDDNFNNQEIINNLLTLKFKHRGFTVGYSDEAQFRWSYCLNIDIPMEDIYKGMDQRCRRCIKKYEKYPLELVDVTNDNIKDFKAIMEHTATRQNHFDRTLEYYQNINEILDKDSKLVIVYLDKKKYLENFKDDKLYNLISQEEKDKIPISAGVFIFDKARANYVYGGTYRQYMPLMAQYKMQMEMIKLAKDLNIPLYDFGGISGNFKEGTENYGVYEFKRGFGGYVVEYIGEFDLILDKFGYTIYNKGYAIYRTIRNLKSKIIKK